MSSLANCIINQNLDYVRQYLQAGTDLNQYDEYGFTPLVEAAIVNNIEIAELLIKHGADVNFKDMVGGTALHWAVENNNQALCELLLKQGADANSYNNYSESVLVKPILRKQEELKDLLYQNGASSTFAYDYINLKLLGHRYELQGGVDIVDAKGGFTELDFEGFVMEFSLDLVRYSLEQFTQNYAAKNLQKYFPSIKKITSALENAAKLIHYQQYLTDRNQHQEIINDLLDEELLILPVVFAGHTISMVRYKNILAIIDRRAREKSHYGICFFKLTKPQAFTKQLMRHLLFDKKTDDYIYQTLPKNLGLQQIARMLIAPQMSGNCSWANLAASLPAALFLLNDTFETQIIEQDHFALDLYRQWRDWDKERALHYCLQAFDNASAARKASIAGALAAVMFQRLSHQDEHDIELGRRILKILREKDYAYILENYLKYYVRQNKTKLGENFEKLLKRCEEIY